MTKRTVYLGFASALTALLLTGCGGTPDNQAAPARQLAGVDAASPPAPDDTTTADGQPGTDGQAADQPATDLPGAGQPADDPTGAGRPGAPATQRKIVKRTVTETASIGYSTRTVRDGSLTKGKRVTRASGRAGERVLTYQVTLTDGKQTAKKLLRSVVTRKPVTKVVAIGTKQTAAGGCDPNYSGACVPIASDVDCAGGSGDGPAYVQGPVRVVGSDIYRLDRDGDGIACD